MHTTSYHAYVLVKEVILSGRLRGGALLSESEIAECIRTRPAPAREAFLRIEAEGSMRLDPKRGARVLLPIDNNEARQMLEARLLVETHCARISMGSPALSEMVGQLQANLVAQRRLRQPGSWPASLNSMPNSNGSSSLQGRHKLLDSFCSCLREQQRRVTENSITRGITWFELIIGEHSHLAELIAVRDGDGCTAALGEHMRSANRDGRAQ
jgi:DNA-binding GntR family transcriptional regulator